MAIDPTLRAEVQAFSTKEGVEASFVEAQRQDGLFEGQKVKELDLNSLIADSAEEASFGASEKVEKKLSERKAGSKEAMRSGATELAEKYVNMTADSQAAKKFHAFLESLKNQEGPVTEQQLKQLLGEHFSDSSDQYAALAFAEESLKSEGGNATLLATVQAVKAQLLKEAGAAIRSGINIAADVMSFSRQGLEGADALRDLYRFAILGGQSIAAIYHTLMKRYGAGQFSKSLEFLLQAAASDLDGTELGSSLDPVQLKASIDDIYHVQSLGNLHRALGDVLDTTRRLYAS